MLKVLLLSFVYFAGVIINGAIAADIVVASKNFTENKILARMLTLIIEKEGYMVEERFDLLTKHLRPKLIKQEVDIYWEYTGAAFRALLRQLTPENIKLSTDPDLLYEKLKELDKPNKIVWLNRTSLNNTYTFLVRRKIAQKYDLTTLDKMAELINQKIPLRLAMDYSFKVRPDGFMRIAHHYRFEYPLSKIKELNHLQVYSALKRGTIDIGVGYGTDPEIVKLQLIRLKDTKHFAPIYNAVPVTHISFFEKYPVLIGKINQISPLIDQETMIQLNYKVSHQNQTIQEVAKQFLKEKRLL